MDSTDSCSGAGQLASAQPSLAGILCGSGQAFQKPLRPLQESGTAGLLLRASAQAVPSTPELFLSLSSQLLLIQELFPDQPALVPSTPRCPTPDPSLPPQEPASVPGTSSQWV